VRNFEVRILDRALSDADNIFDCIAVRSPVGAARWYAEFLSAAQDLANDQSRHGIAPEGELISSALRQRLFRTRRGRLYRMLFVIVEKRSPSSP
jgi:plasmid stabilization system protein ParE